MKVLVAIAKGALILVALAIIGTTYHLYQEKTRPVCARVVSYAVGTLDERFGLSEAEANAALSEAAAVWNKAIGRDVFVLTYQDPSLPVHFMYDSRQKTAELGKEIDSEQARYQAKRRAVDTLVAEYENARSSLEATSAAFERRAQAYEEEVRRWNQQGGAPQSEYERLESERRALDRERARLNAQTDAVNQLADRVNVAVGELNMLAAQVNAQAEAYNTQAGHDYDQGQYLRDESGSRIQIYEFTDRKELVRVLAHEFGHALGIEHNENPASIMYSYNISGSLTLSEEDKAALAAVCPPKGS